MAGIDETQTAKTVSEFGAQAVGMLKKDERVEDPGMARNVNALLKSGLADQLPQESGAAAD